VTADNSREDSFSTAKSQGLSRPGVLRSLSANLLALTALFVMLAEVLIYLPSISRFRLAYLEERAAEGHLATLALDASRDRHLSPPLERKLLDYAGVLAVELWRPKAELMLGTMPSVDAAFDLRNPGPWSLIEEALRVLWIRGERTIAVTTSSREGREVRVKVFLDERDLYAEMYAYSWRILKLSIIISLIAASLVYLSLQWLMVRPMRRLTIGLGAFRARPDQAAAMLQASARADELGVLQREVARMQREVHTSLAQQARLAALGTAVSKITHDLRNILSTADLFAERLKHVNDPAAQRITPLLVSSLDRALQLCTQTLDLARGDRIAPKRSVFALRTLLEEVGNNLGLGSEGAVDWTLDLPQALQVEADYERLFRALLNLCSNAVQAIADRGSLRVAARRLDHSVRIEIADTGSGIPDEAVEHLFEPFAGSARSGGTGLGLATARDLVRAHGGELSLVRTGPEGTTFRIELPA
jgi:signal transduction histidine kinase